MKALLGWIYHKTFTFVILLKKLLRFSKNMKPLTRKQKDDFDLYIERHRKRGNAQKILEYIPKQLLKHWEPFLNCLYTKAPRTIRVNTLKFTPKEFELYAKKKNWQVSQHPIHETIYRFSKNSWVSYGNTSPYQQGLFYSQGLASQIAGLALSVQPGDRVLDMSAAPGSKTTQLAILMNNTGSILAVDSSKDRLDICIENIQRLGVSNTKTLFQDARKLEKTNIGTFDKILLDAPCSSEGILRNKPHIALQWTPETVYSHAKLQKELIFKGYELLNPGGILLYSTCTLNKMENEEVIEFLFQKKQHTCEILEQKRISPNIEDTIGFFFAKIKKH